MERYQTAGRRIVAALIDAIIFLPFYLIENYFIDTSDNATNLSWTLLSDFLSIFYAILFHMIYGQTIGKAFMDVKVMDLSEDRIINFKQAVMRDIVYIGLIVVDWVYLIYILIVHPQHLESSLVRHDMVFIFTFLFWCLLEIGSMFFNSKRRAVQDYLAGTIVVRTDIASEGLTA